MAGTDFRVARTSRLSLPIFCGIVAKIQFHIAILKRNWVSGIAQIDLRVEPKENAGFWHNLRKVWFH